MFKKMVCTGMAVGGVLVCGLMAAYGADDFMAQAQQMYDEAYDQAQQMYDEAYDQAQAEFNEAYDQALAEIMGTAGGSEGNGGGEGTEEKYAPKTDKIKNYVGRNAASFGYCSLGGDRLDDGYGGTLDTLKVVLAADDGSYIDISDDEVLKQYVVTAQNIEPDTDLTFHYSEYGIAEHQTFDEIELLCKKVAEDTEDPVLTGLTMINPSPDKTTQYVKDYVGRNLATIGYTGLDGSWHEEYNGTFNTVDLVVITDDGSFIEPDDKEMQKQYVVTSQNPAANSELLFSYSDYGFVDSQTYSEIELYVSKLH